MMKMRKREEEKKYDDGLVENGDGVTRVMMMMMRTRKKWMVCDDGGVEGGCGMEI